MPLRLEPSLPVHPAAVGCPGPGNMELSPMRLVQNATQVLGELLVGGLYDNLVLVSELAYHPLKRILRQRLLLLILENPLNLRFVFPQVAAAEGHDPLRVAR